MPKGQHTTKGTVSISAWARRNQLSISRAQGMATRGDLDPFRLKGNDGKVVPYSGLVDEAGATAWLKQHLKERASATGRAAGLKHGAVARREQEAAKKREARANALKDLVRATEGELDRSHLDPNETMQLANDRRAQLEADKVELQVAELRRKLCVRLDLLALVADCWIRLCRQFEGIPRLDCDKVIVAVQGPDTRITTAQREAVQNILETAIERELRQGQDALEKIIKESGGPK